MLSNQPTYSPHSLVHACWSGSVALGLVRASMAEWQAIHLESVGLQGSEPAFPSQVTSVSQNLVIGGCGAIGLVLGLVGLVSVHRGWIRNLVLGCYGAYCHRVTARTSWPGISTLWLDDLGSLICCFYLFGRRGWGAHKKRSKQICP